MGIKFYHVNLTFWDVLKTNCNPNPHPGIEVVHGKMMPFRRHALHFICIILTKTVCIC